MAVLAFVLLLYCFPSQAEDNSPTIERSIRSELENINKTLGHIHSVELAIGGLTLFVTVLGVCYTICQIRFDAHQRTVEIAFKMNEVWESVLDASTRFKMMRVYGVLDIYEKTSPDQIKLLFKIILDAKNMVAATPVTLNTNEPLKALIGESTNASEIQMQISDYRTALLRCLNTFEAVAIIRNSARKSHRKTAIIIEDQFWNNIKWHAERLKIFKDVYDEVLNNNKPKAWCILYKECNVQVSDARTRSTLL